MKGFLPTYDGCIICGSRKVNPAAMGVRFFWDGEKVEARFRPDDLYNGYRGILHGGLITALLDEGMGWAAGVERKTYFVTGELSIRFLQPVHSNQLLRLVARCTGHFQRYSTSEGQLMNEAGEILARGRGKFFEIPLEEAMAIKQYLHFHPGDLDILEKKSSG